jgi:hypothetical protein
MRSATSSGIRRSRLPAWGTDAPHVHVTLFEATMDKYARQLGLATHQFDRLLDQADLRELKQLLKSKFPSHADDTSHLVP